MPSAIEQTMQAARVEVDRTQAEVASAEAALAEPRSEIESMKAEAEKLRAEIDRAASEGDVAVPVREHSRRIRDLRREIEDCQAECAPLEKFLRERQAEYTRARAAVSLLEAQEIEDEAEVVGRDMRGAMDAIRECVGRLQALTNDHYVKTRQVQSATDKAGFRQTTGLRTVAAAAGITRGELEAFRSFLASDAAHAL